MIKKIKVLSDGNELEYSQTVTQIIGKTKKTFLEYVYVKSKTKLGMKLPLEQIQLDLMIKNGICKAF